MFKKENIRYKGSYKIQISEEGIKECRFYLLDKGEVTIGCKDYFILNNRKRYFEQDSVKVMPGSIIVTFDEEIIINNEIIRFRKKEVSEEVLEEFLYTLALYHIENNQHKSAEIVLANTKDINAYIDFMNNEETFNKEVEVKNLQRLIQDKDSRFKAGKTKIKFEENNIESRCLLEILNEINEDVDSMLLWKLDNKYERIGIKKKVKDNKFSFNRFKDTYGEVLGVNIGNKKLNIGVTVKINGQVENLENNLKLDASIYREYNLISNCKVNNKFIWCILSKKLKNKLSKEKLISVVTNSKYKNQQVYAININNISISSKKIIDILTKEEIAKYLYDIEVLKCKSLLLNRKIQDLKEEDVEQNIEYENNLSKEQIKIRKEFRVNSSGVYLPENIEEDHEENIEVYIADILEWGVDRFPKKRIEDYIKFEISKIIHEDNTNVYKKLMEELESVKKIKKSKENIINAIKMSAFIYNINIFNWDSEEYKEKTSFDKTININAIIAGRVKVSTKKIYDITIKQNYFKIIVKSSQ